jgi:hypothetical protein
MPTTCLACFIHLDLISPISLVNNQYY